MKGEKWLSCLTGVVLAFALAMGGIGCIATAFDLQSVNMAAVAAVCGMWVLICALCFTIRHGVLILAAGGALLVGYLLREGGILLQVEAFLHRISQFFDAAYGWGTIYWSGEELAQVPKDGALLLIGGFVAILTIFSVCRRKTVFFAASIGFLPLGLCFVVTDTIPDAPYIWLMAVSLILLLMTQSVRKKDEKAGLRLTAMLLIPVMLMSMLLLWCNPREDYQYPMEKLHNKVTGLLGELPFLQITADGNLTIDLNMGNGPIEDLTKVGPKTLRQYPVMDVVAPRGGVLYLRGQSLDVYSGTGWDASQVSTGEDMFFPKENMRSAGWVSVSTRSFHTRQYVPYYLARYDLTSGTIDNLAQLQEYRYEMWEPQQGSNVAASVTVDRNRPILYQCLQLPDSTRKAAESILDAIYADGIMPRGVTGTAQMLQSYVQNSARYDLNTPAMPEDEKDFAIWFLKESETGYCVHFATALTVLLRAADIPARYVTGYTFDAAGGTKTVVRAADAHAWVEYMDPEKGWTVLDATPAVWMEQEETTQPPQTEAVETEPTEPDTTTAPTEQTVPDTEQESSTQATLPIGGAEPGDVANVDENWLWKVLLWVASLAVVLGGQYGIRRAIKVRKMRKGRRNKRALALWQEVKRMARITGQAPAENLRELAEKAKFSQHTITMEELAEFDLWLEQARRCLKEKTWIVRLTLRLVYAVE